MDKRLKNLQVTFTDYGNQKWPSEDYLDNDRNQILYSPRKHHILCGNPKAASGTYVRVNGQHGPDGKSKLHQWVERHGTTDHEPASDWMRPALIDFARERAERGDRAKARKEFVTAVTGGFKVETEMTIRNYLNGVTTGGSDVKIDDQTLNLYGLMLVERIAPDEYLLGAEMSGMISGSQNHRLAVAAIILLRSGVKLWPSVKSYQSEEWSHADRVLSWVLNRLKIVQIKMPTARKVSKASYALLHDEAVKVYREALNRWPDDITDDMTEDIERYIKVFGNVQEMKDFNQALQMEYTMTGVVT